MKHKIEFDEIFIEVACLVFLRTRGFKYTFN